MTLIVSTVVVIALLIAVLAIYLFMIGMLLNRTADNLGDCVQSVRTIRYQAEVVGPGIKRINKTGGDLLGAMPLLVEGAEGVASKLAPAAPVPTPAAVASEEVGRTAGVGYLDV